MQLGRIITPDAVRAALELVRREYERDHTTTEAARAALRRFTEYTSVMGHMLADNYSLWGVRDKQLRGMGMLCGDSIALLCVEHGYRRHGIGRVLCESLLDHAAEQGSRRVTVNARPDTLSFFTRLGFVAGTEREHLGMVYIPMEKAVPE